MSSFLPLYAPEAFSIMIAQMNRAIDVGFPLAPKMDNVHINGYETFIIDNKPVLVYCARSVDNRFESEKFVKIRKRVKRLSKFINCLTVSQNGVDSLAHSFFIQDTSYIPKR